MVAAHGRLSIEEAVEGEAGGGGREAAMHKFQPP